MLSKEYSIQHVYYDKVVRRIKEVEILREMYEAWSTKRLRVWQYTILKRVLEQGERTVTWIYDVNGNNGKTYLANYLNILYKFQLFDGQINCRDLAGILNVNAIGVCLDVCRAAESQLDYNTIECLKNGCINSGKYSGKVLRFKPMKLVVFSNFFPDCTKLSQDRWDILPLGEGILSNLEAEDIIIPSAQYPFVPPPASCNLSPSFDLHAYLIHNGIIESDGANAPSISTGAPAASSSHDGKYILGQ